MCRTSRRTGMPDRDFRQGSGDPAGAYTRANTMTYRDDYRRLLRAGGFAIWAAVGMPVVVLSSLRPVRHPLLYLAWVGALLVYAAAFWRATAARNRAPSSRAAARALAAIEA